MLDERKFGCKALRLFARRSAGQTVDCGRFGQVTIESFSVSAARECQIVLLAVSGSFSTQFAEEIAGGPMATVVIDNSSAFRYKANIPLVIPEINGRQCVAESIIANPNCTTAIGAMALWPIHQKYRLKKVIMSTYQAASGAGAEGMQELEDGVRQYTVDGTIPKPTVFQHPLAFNCIPHIDAFQANGYSKEEMKVAWELRKIFGLPEHVKISCTAVRVPTLRAHSEAITVETELPINPEDVRELLRSAEGLEVFDDVNTQTYPLPARAAGKNAVEVGRIRQSLVFGKNGIDLFVSGDQLLRGAALNAVIIAERVFRGRSGQGMLTPWDCSSPMIGQIPWHVHKFGGAALANADMFRRVADQLIYECTEAQGHDVIVPTAAVVSATEGTTDELITLAERAASGASADAIRLLDAVFERHKAIVHVLIFGDENAEIRERVLADMNADRDNVVGILGTVALLHTVGPMSISYIGGMGETWSARILTAYLQSLNCTVAMMDAREVITVAGNGGSLGEKGAAVDMGSQVLYEASMHKLDTWWGNHDDQLTPTAGKLGLFLVVTGFIAVTESGVPTTLKRSGTDFSATILAKLLRSGTVTLWKTVNGVYTADPQSVPTAFSVPSLSYEEAIELAYFGGQVLHPSAMAPCIEQSIRLKVRNILEPAFLGTRIVPSWVSDRVEGSGSASPRETIPVARAPLGAVKVVTTIKDVALIEVRANSWASVSVVTSRAMTCLHEAGITIVLITQASSEFSLSLAVDATSAADAKRALKSGFELELMKGNIDGVRSSTGYSVLTVVGPMRGVQGTLAKLTSGVTDAGANVFAVAQGSSERSISIVIETEKIDTVVHAVHDKFLGLSASLGIMLNTTVGSV